MSDTLIPASLVVPDQELVQEILDHLELAYTVDEKGALLTAWPGFRIYYLFEGDRRELFTIRAFYDRTYPAEDKPQLLDALDDWNRDTLWPKVYTHEDAPDGLLRVIGELELLIGSGVGLGSFGAMTENFTFSAVAFEDWLIERLDLATDDSTTDDYDLEEGEEEGEGEEEEEQEEDEDFAPEPAPAPAPELEPAPRPTPKPRRSRKS